MMGVEQSIETGGGKVVWAQGDTLGWLFEGSEFGSLLTIPPTSAARKMRKRGRCEKNIACDAHVNISNIGNVLKQHCSLQNKQTNKLVVLTTGWLPWLQSSWRDNGYERFTLVRKTNCIRQPKRQLPSSSYNHILQPQYTEPSSSYNHNTLKMLNGICNDSFKDVLRVVSVLWL